VNSDADVIAAMMSDLLVWSEKFEAGAITDPAIDPQSGERVAIRIPKAAAVGAFTRPDELKILTVYAKGDIVATDRRVLVLDGSAVIHTWTWASDMGADSTLESDGHGALFMPSEAAHAAGARHLLGTVPAGLLKRRKPARGLYFPMIAAWSRVIAAHQESRGELESWRDRQRFILESNRAAE
jgi:hypothetical protein